MPGSQGTVPLCFTQSELFCLTKAYLARHTKRAFVTNDQMKSCPTKGIFYTSLKAKRAFVYLKTNLNLASSKTYLTSQVTIKTNTNIAFPNQKQTASTKHASIQVMITKT